VTIDGGGADILRSAKISNETKYEDESSCPTQRVLKVHRMMQTAAPLYVFEI